VFFGVWAALCLFYWFFTAPDLRFGAVLFQIFFALSLAFAVNQAVWPASWEAHYARFLQNRRASIIGSAFFLLMAILISAGQLHSAARSVLHVGSMPSKKLSSRTLDRSVSPPILLFFPASGDDRCGNSPLPCAPSDALRLTLRVPGRLGGGFYIGVP
jgi:hypothetical protein